MEQGRAPPALVHHDELEGPPLVSYRVIVDLISATTTDTGLTVRCELDSADYPKGIVVSDREIDDLNISRDAFHGEWNYTLQPTSPSVRALVSG